MNETRRSQRLGDLILHEAAAILQRQVKDPRVALVTLTGVDVSRDLRVAKVFFSCMDPQADPENTRRGLDSAQGFIRRELARTLELKAVPELRFHHDDSLERGFRVQDVIESLHLDPEE
ncbi:MAG: 30S ribosome-binding factor RbfA [Deferrisomatales bacterium]|nr:30S ribosome-binding factor RbfA [Deferrisomatales bacterium]HSH68984.1 30S ribosome-binding factor RbfA [Deferrisomatales bacterium]